MAYVRPGSTAKRHATDLYEMEQIARASSYAIHFRKGPFETYSETAGTMIEAKAVEMRLNADHGQFGRRAMIYAVTPEGRHVPMPSGSA